MIVHTDKEGWVIDVEPDIVDSIRRDIVRADMPTLETKLCKGPWHYKSGKGTPLPIDQFPMNRYKTGQRTATCADCLNRSGKRSPVPLGVKAETRLTLKDIDNGMGSGVHKWKVLVLQPVEVVVYAKTYSEIPSEVTGEVLRVERLD